MKTKYVNYSEFFRALKRNVSFSKYPVVVSKYGNSYHVAYWFFTQKLVWSYTISDPVEQNIIDKRLKEIDKVILDELGEVR